MLNFFANRWIIAFFIIVIIIAVLGIPFTNWWLTGDDFGGIFIGFKSTSWKDIFYFFYEGNAGQGLGNPGGYITDRGDFLRVYYRPLYCIYLTLQYWCFGTNGYGYFLCNVTAHAASASLLFYLISFYTSRWTALLATGLFALHPQIAYRFGSVVNFHYYVNVFLMISIALLLRNYINNNKQRQLYLSLMLFAISLCTRETTLVLPGIISLLLLVDAYNKKTAIPWQGIFLITSLFGFIAVGYISLRFWLYPLTNITANGIFLPQILKGSFVATKTQEFLVFLYDLLFLSWLPWGNKLLKITTLFPLLSLLSYTFYQCHQKLLTITLFTCGILMIWPGLISFYSPRYIYESMPFFVAGYAALFSSSALRWPIKIALKILVSIFISSLSIFAFFSFQAREKKLYTMHTAVTNLVHNLNKTGRPLCFLTTPSDGFAGGYNPHIFWILFNNRDHKIYFDSALSLTQLDSNIVKTEKWFNAIAPYYNQNYVVVTPIEKGFCLESIDPKKIIFENTMNNRTPSIGTLTVLQKNSRGLATAIELRINNELWAQKPFFINWNYTTKQFDIIDQF